MHNSLPWCACPHLGSTMHSCHAQPTCLGILQHHAQLPCTAQLPCSTHFRLPTFGSTMRPNALPKVRSASAFSLNALPKVRSASAFSLSALPKVRLASTMRPLSSRKSLRSGWQPGARALVLSSTMHPSSSRKSLRSGWQPGASEPHLLTRRCFPMVRVLPFRASACHSAH